MGDRSPALHYEPYDDLGGAPNVVLDGSPTVGTVLCLTHWPGISGPPEHAADLSAQMAFSYLDAFDLHAGAEVVTNNHFDQDGLVSVFALSDPEAALARRKLLIDVAAAGDFAVYRNRDAARISMVLAALADPERTPLAGVAELSDYGEMCAALYTEVLWRVPELCDYPDRFHSLWEEEDAGLRASEEALRSGAVAIWEVPDVDLAVVSVPENAPDGGGHRFAAQWVPGLHPMAVHNATERGALLMHRGDRTTFTYRYESWVQYRSRKIRPRVDLSPLAEQLSAEEPGAAVWVAEPVSGLTPSLFVAGDGASGLAPERIRALVEEHLRRAPAAWDPFAVVGTP
jgi:hypothetical protein